MHPSHPAVRLATPAEIDAVLAMTHPLWGRGIDLATYRARTHALLATSWGRERYRFWVATDAEGRIVASCKVYRFEGRLDAVATEILGFGAVFTHPDHRSRGHAARLLRAILAAPGRATAALLFSDIGPAFYARLGFSTLGTLLGTADALPGLSGLSPWPSKLAPPVPLPRPDTLSLGHSPDQRAYLQLRNAPETLAWRPDGGRLAGHALVHVVDGELRVVEASCEPGYRLADLLTALRREAGARKLPRVHGWLPAEAVEAGFALRLVTDGVPMLARLDGGTSAPPPHVWDHEHF